MIAGLVITALSVLFISTFAGASPLLIVAGGMGVGAGLSLVQPSANNAAANALPNEQVAAGMGLFAGAYFLGGGTGPALIGAFLATRQEAGARALNPLYAFDAAPHSDAFLVMALAPIAGLIASFGLRSGVTGPSTTTGVVDPDESSERGTAVHLTRRLVQLFRWLTWQAAARKG